MRLRSLGRTGIEPVDACEKPFDIEIFRLCRLRHWLVVHREVVHDVRVRMRAPVHALEAVPDDVPELVAVGGVIGNHGLVG